MGVGFRPYIQVRQCSISFGQAKSVTVHQNDYVPFSASGPEIQVKTTPTSLRKEMGADPSDSAGTGFSPGLEAVFFCTQQACSSTQLPEPSNLYTVKPKP